MKRYEFDHNMREYLEGLRIPMAVYQFIDKRVVTLVLSAGFRDLFEFDDLSDAYYVMENDMYSTAHPDDASRIADCVYRFATQGGKLEMVYRLKMRKSQGYKIIHAIGEHVFLETGERLAYVSYTDEGIYSEESGGEDEFALAGALRRVLREESMVHRTYYDNLTGMPNMTYFFELAEAGRRTFVRNGEKTAILFTDLSGMKLFNDKYGFSEGDKLLKLFAKVLTKHFSNENCSRFGQDHFAVFTTVDGLNEKIGQIIKETAELNDGKTLPLKIGVYLDETGAEEISRACDKATYACGALKKVYGSAYKYYSDAILKEEVNRRYFVDNLDRAIEENWIKVYYQPIVRAANGRVCGEEALSRWIDPEKGMQSPADFIPAVEEAKVIYKLDLYVVEQILHKIKEQRERGLDSVPVSVNISRNDFDSCDMVEEIRCRVDESGVERNMLNIEITESVIGTDFEFIKEQVERFKALGFQVWMDDFGSGYSSLDVLQSIRFDLIKLDMRFMQDFNKSEDSRIILTELIKMAIGLRIDTVCEGVETAEQVEFLREVGCTKLQGYYFTKPIPQEAIYERYRKGIQIGFEDPEQTDYYAAIGRVNLYDTAIIAEDDKESLGKYFDTIPMAIIETDGDTFTLIRCNNSYRTFMERSFGVIMIGTSVDYKTTENMRGNGFLKALRNCGFFGGRMLIDEEISEGTMTHAFLKRIAFNQKTNTAAVAVAVLSVNEAKEEGDVTFVHLAKALSSDYFNLFYVNLETERFSEFTSDPDVGQLAVERRGEDFFAASRRDAMSLIYEPDREAFVKAFTKENVVHALDTDGTFNVTYRLLIDGQPIFVNMKAVRMKAGDDNIIIGVSNVDAQMRQKEALERVRAERETYSRLMTLAGDFICIYTVDPVTEHYNVYSESSNYKELGIKKEGDAFFESSLEEGKRAVYPEDYERFRTMFTKENILYEIGRSGLFVLKYRLMLDGKPTYVNVKAAMFEEKDGPQLIIGINNVDEQVKKEIELTNKLAQAKAKASVDVVTGVKNRRAFADIEERLDARINSGEEVSFAIVLFEVKGLAAINEKKGKTAGDNALKDACRLVCETFKHSPVFRVLDEQFAVIAIGRDYDVLDGLMERISKMSRRPDGLTLYSGLSSYKKGDSVSAVFDRADSEVRSKIGQ